MVDLKKAYKDFTERQQELKTIRRRINGANKKYSLFMQRLSGSDENTIQKRLDYLF